MGHRSAIWSKSKLNKQQTRDTRCRKQSGLNLFVGQAFGEGLSETHFAAPQHDLPEGGIS